MYDIIGDIHGHAEELKKLLKKLDYSLEDGYWRHESRKCIFVGDYIDRGPCIRETLQIIKRMVDNGSAIALMGNHEFNALAYHNEVSDGEYLRPHKTKNVVQHAQTLAQFFRHYKEWDEYLEWFYTLPLFVEINGIRIVHACWDDEHMDWLLKHYSVKEDDQIQPVLKENDGASFSLLNRDLLIKAHKDESKEYKIIEDVLKGKEVDIPEKYAWEDKDGNRRKKNRIKWWKKHFESTYGEFLFHCPKPLQDIPFDQELEFNVYPESAPPVFFGHYWLNPDKPEVMSKNVVCLDYSVAKEGALIAYRWNKDESIAKANFVSVKAGSKSTITKP